MALFLQFSETSVCSTDPRQVLGI